MANRRATAHPARPARSLSLGLWLWGSCLITLGAAVALFFADVRLGQGYFAILYSPVADWRLQRAIPSLLLASAAAGSVWALAQRDQSSRIAGRIILSLFMVGAGVWVWWAPPDPASQHAFNFTSRSADGAFVVESLEGIPSTPKEYLRTFPTSRLQQSVQEMRGSRVLSNPPLMTVLVHLISRWAAPDHPGSLEQTLIESHGVAKSDARGIALALRFSIVLTLIWTLSGFAAYALGRRFLSPAGAGVFAIVATFNPCTVNYAPGKDPGQLLTINLMLWAWFSAWQQRSSLRAALAGALFILGCTSGLIHIWIATIALLATAWQTWTQNGRRGTIGLIHIGLAAAGGAGIVCGIAFLALDWNIPLTLWAVSAKWTEVNAAIVRSRPVWFFIGLPIFLLFLSPGLWTLFGLAIRHRRWNFGMRLLLCTVTVMLFIYVMLGVTNELPRLWIAFLPLLTLGAAAAVPMLQRAAVRPRIAMALAAIVGVQIIFTSLHWTLFDARESEERLLDKRFYE